VPSPNGAIAQIGVLTGFDLRPNLLPLSRLNANIVGIQTGSRDHFEDMNRFIEEHRIAPVVDRARRRRTPQSARMYANRMSTR
jgi:NADPH:quinone reductase-like Zn-dependent oxidoreductase